MRKELPFAHTPELDRNALERLSRWYNRTKLNFQEIYIFFLAVRFLKFSNPNTNLTY